MVLHNSKWDRRAKTRYLKKHGLSTDRDGKPTEHDDVLKTPETIPNDDDNSRDDEIEVPNLEQGIEIENAFPNEEEQDDEEMKLIRRHLKEQSERQQNENSSSLNSSQKPHIQLGSKEIFERAQAGAARSKLNSQVKRFTQKNPEISIDSDSDFDDFMDELDDAEVTDIPEKKPDTSSKAPLKSNMDKYVDRQAFLDKAIGK